MSQRLFVSYAAADREQISPFIAALKAAGFDVWWDQNIPGGARYHSEIEKALKAADLVIVGWSETANESDWVKDEAELARDHDKLFPVSLDGTMPPMGFRQYQVEPFPERSDSANFDLLIKAIKQRLSGENQPRDRSRKNTRKNSGAAGISKIMFGFAVLLLAVLAGWFALNNSKKEALPLVMIMDSAHPARIYDEDVKEKGGTNADILAEILSDLPIQTQKELISPLWQRNEAVLKFHPDLIVIHYSGFKQEDSSGPRPQLKLLIEYFADTDTRFLIYSRAGEDWLQAKVDIILDEIAVRHPDIKSRVEVFPLLEYGDPYWADPGPAQAIKLHVKEILGLGQD